MKLYRPIITGIVDCVGQVFNEGRYADKVLEKMFKANRKWGGRDRKMVAESVYDIVRWGRRYVEANGVSWRDEDFVFFGEKAGKLPLLEQQLWNIVFSWLTVKGVDLPDWSPLSEKFPKEKFLSVWGNPDCDRKIKLSLPDWLDHLGHGELQDEWEPLIKSMNQVAPVFLRTNCLRAHQDDVMQALLDEEIVSEPLPNSKVGVRVLEKNGRRPNVFKTEAFKKGWFEVQDGGSQEISPFLQVVPGHRVVDACAGAGGKTLQIAAEMGNKGRVIAMDIEAWKLQELKKRTRRAGFDIVETRPIESSKTIKRLKQSADRVLLDVPCSGLGVLRRNPDTKWRLTPARLDELRAIQKDILARYSQMVKPGGKLVYATCSVLASENENQIMEFMQQNSSNWLLEEQKRVWPHKTNFDGFYMARLLRK